MELKPLNDRVVVRRVDAETVTKSGIVIPDTAAEKPDQGKVLAVGNGRRADSGERIPLAVQVNDRVLFSKYAGITVRHKGEDYLVLKEDDILAVVEG